MQQSAPALRLRRLVNDDAAAFDAAHRATADYEFGLGYSPGMPFAEYVAQHERHRSGIDLPNGLVSATFLVAEVDDTIVGRSSIRHQLNEWLLREGGHIGYCVVPEHRRRGYATAILRHSLVVARSLGISSALLVCDDDNLASATVIERCGGKLENIVVGEDGRLVRRYWIS